MHRYETLFVLHPETAEARLRETIDRASNLIERMGGQLTDLQEWGVRDLAYPIRKQVRGIYVLVQYSAPRGVLNELERTLKIADEVLRFVSVRQAEAKRGAPAESKGGGTIGESRSVESGPEADEGPIVASEQGI